MEDEEEIGEVEIEGGETVEEMGAGIGQWEEDLMMMIEGIVQGKEVQWDLTEIEEGADHLHQEDGLLMMKEGLQ